MFPARTALLACLLFVFGLAAVSAAAERKPPAAQAATASGYTVTRAAAPARSVVRSSTGAWVATFTDGARTVALAGPARTFSEAARQVTTSTWVRVLAAPFAGTVDYAWLDRARADRSPDVLATAFEFVSGRPDRRDASGRLIAGDASYGPLEDDDDGAREEGSDWNDLQGVTARYGSVADPPEPEQTQSLDCSGFMRMLWGVRIGLPLGLDPDWWGVRAVFSRSLEPNGRWLPRRSSQQATAGPGVVPIANAGKRVSDFTRLQPGDLVFFDASVDDGAAIDHVGLYLGRDTAGHKRFISSRESADGPTMGDYNGASLLDGTGLYARSFRSTRRL